MSRFSEETFNHWKRPASESEEARISNAISMIKDAIRASEELQNRNIEVFVQGSYANNTNVRAESDVDVCIMLKDTFYSSYPTGLTREHYGFTAGTNNFQEFRKSVYRALLGKFGEKGLTPDNKSIKIHSNSYRVDADAVPSFQYRNYRYLGSRKPKVFKEGVKFYSLSNDEIINYPKINIENGRLKNEQTGRKYKRLVRILKRIRYQMIKEGVSVSSKISSFLIECLVWNIPNNIINNYSSWTERVKAAIAYLYNKTKNPSECKEWREVSEMLYLFHNGRKWDVKTVNQFLIEMRNYLEFK
ncbi:nucleotidyltransferase [Bernardetia sp. ABR2-2B]|uniref:nucleotidyltransferase domain-containing protein n=1 Tax=Bernardetia sp. ABR2-2B TaxID=3127472 RepID=UPI0030CD1E1A